MNKKSLLKNVTSEIKTFVKLHQLIIEGDKVSKIEIDIAMEKLRVLYDAYLQIGIAIDDEEVRSVGFISSDKSTEAETINTSYDEKKEDTMLFNNDKEEIVVETSEEEVIAAIPEEEIKEVEPIQEEDSVIQLPFESTEHIIEQEIQEEIQEEIKAIEEEEEIVVQTEEKQEVPLLFSMEQEKVKEVETEIIEEKVKEIEIEKIEEAKETTEIKKPQQNIAEKFEGNSPSLNDKLSGINETKSFASHMEQSQIIDIKEAIGLNLRFTFLKELFTQDINIYNDTIRHLNSLSDYNEAITVFKKYENQFSWNENTEAYKKLYNLVERKYR